MRSPAGERSFLVIRDVAGEDLEDRTPDAKQLEFFARADGVLFLFDPLKVPDVREFVRDLVPDQFVGGDPHLVLENVLRLVGNGTPRFALVVAKFDTMQQVGLTSTNTTAWTHVHTGGDQPFPQVNSRFTCPGHAAAAERRSKLST